MRYILILVVLIVTPDVVSGQGYSIQGRISGFSGQARVYLEDVESQSILDSCDIKNELFLLTGKLYEAPRRMTLIFNDNGKRQYGYMLIGNDNIRLTGKRSDLPYHLTIKGSPIQDDFTRLINGTRDYYPKRDTVVGKLMKVWGDTSKTGRTQQKAFIAEMNRIDQKTDSIDLAFIRNNANTYAALYRLFSMRKKMPRAEISNILQALKPVFQQSQFAKKLETFLKVGDELKTGDKYADFEALDPAGKTHRLSGLAGQYILLDFTSTYCGPCILAVDELREIEETYKNKVRIVSFYTDKSKEVYAKGIARDKPGWLALWDGQGSASETLLKYGVLSFPTFVLIDPSGKLLARTEGFGKGNLNKLMAERVK